MLLPKSTFRAAHYKTQLEASDVWLEVRGNGAIEHGQGGGQPFAAPPSAAMNSRIAIIPLWESQMTLRAQAV